MTRAFLTGEISSFATIVPAVTRAVSAGAKAKMGELAKKHGLSAAQQAEPARLAVVEKIVSGGFVTVEEFETLLDGAQPDARAAVARSYPAVARQTYR